MCIRDSYTIGRPGIVKVQVITKIFGQNRSMEWTDDLDIQVGSFLQKSLNLYTVFSNDTDVITTSLTSPVFLYIQCSKFTECVCGEQDFIFGIKMCIRDR